MFGAIFVDMNLCTVGRGDDSDLVVESNTVVFWAYENDSAFVDESPAAFFFNSCDIVVKGRDVIPLCADDFGPGRIQGSISSIELDDGKTVMALGELHIVVPWFDQCFP